MEIIAFENILPNEINNKILKFLSHPTADIIKPYILAHRKFIDDRYNKYRDLDDYEFYSFRVCMIHDDINNRIHCTKYYNVFVRIYWRDDYYEYGYACDNCNNKRT